MWLKQFFFDTPIRFEKRCRTRIFYSCLLICLGVAAIVIVRLPQDQLPLIFRESHDRDFISGFYLSTGFALVVSGILTIIRNLHDLHTPEQKHKKEIAENDERNRLLGLRCWAYSGYALFLILYLSILASGFISILVLKTLLCVLAVYALLLLCFKIMLQKIM